MKTSQYIVKIIMEGFLYLTENFFNMLLKNEQIRRKKNNITAKTQIIPKTPPILISFCKSANMYAPKRDIINNKKFSIPYKKTFKSVLISWHHTGIKETTLCTFLETFHNFWNFYCQYFNYCIYMIKYNVILKFIYWTRP